MSSIIVARDVAYEFSDGRELFKHLTFSWIFKDDLHFVWRGNVRVALKGPNGSGKSTLLRALMGETFETRGVLNRGERVRAALARGLLGTQKPELLLLDEPTNNLDLTNIEFLERVLKEFRGALVVVSHDQRFLDNGGKRGQIYFA